MGKASRKKQRGVEAAPATPAVSYPQAPGWAAPALFGVAVAGMALAGVSTWVYAQVSASGGAYTSFCNVSEVVNCDSVVASPHGKIARVPVSIWALGFYVVLGLVAWRAWKGAAPARERARADALALALFGGAFSAYMAVVSLAVLGALCLVCGGLYVVAAAALFAAWKLGSPLAASARRWRERTEQARRRPGLSTAVVAAAVVLLLVPSWLGAPTLMTREEVFRANPKFYDWYTSQPVVDTPIEGGHGRGPEQAPIRLVEFSDFECPHCRRAHVTLKDLLSRYPTQVRFVFHHFPLSNECNDAMEAPGHAHACEAAVASECASEQEQFDAFANLLFANQENLGPATLRKLAKEARLDLERFEKCVDSPEAAARVEADVQAGKRAGVRSTPTFFLNGRRLEGNLTYENWLHAFAIELDRG